MKYEKAIMVATGVAAQFWQLFVIMAVWNMFASSYHLFTFGEIIWAQLLVQGLSFTQGKLVLDMNSSEKLKPAGNAFADNIVASVTMFLLFGGLLLVAYVVKFFQ
jgi:hypothetical protein